MIILLGQISAFTLYAYAPAFRDANDPEKSYRFGWGPIVIVTFFAISTCIFSVLGAVNHVFDLNKSKFERKQEVKAKIRGMS